MPKRIKNAKIALIDFNLTKQKLNMGVTVNITDPSKLEGVLQRYVSETQCALCHRGLAHSHSVLQGG